MIAVIEAFRLCVQLPPEKPVREGKGSAVKGSKRDKEEWWRRRHKHQEVQEEEQDEPILRSNWVRCHPDMPQPRAGAGSIVIGQPTPYILTIWV